MTEYYHGRVLNIVEIRAGTELASDHLLGATTLFVYDTSDFSEEGGSLEIEGVIYTYNTVDDELETVTLSTGLTAAWTADTEVFLYPPSIAKEAEVQLDELEDAQPVRVPHTYVPALEAIVRDAFDEESVMIKMEDNEWVIHDIIADEYKSQGEYIDPSTLPEPDVSDGIPPASSPTPTTTSLKDSVLLKWTPVLNHDLVTYEIHVSDVDGFTPVLGGPTKAGEVKGSMANVSTLGDGTPLEYEVTDGDGNVTSKLYYFRIIAFDEDGAAAPGVQASGFKSKTASGDLAANSVTAVQLAAIIAMANLFTTRGLDIEGLPTGPGLDFGDTARGLGLFSYDANGDPDVEMPSGGKKVWRGDAHIDFLTVQTLTTLLATSLSEGAVFTLEQGVVDPLAPPTVNAAWDKRGPGWDLAGYTWNGWAVNTAGTHAYMFQTVLQSNGGLYKAPLDNPDAAEYLVQLPGSTNHKANITVGGGYVWVLMEQNVSLKQYAVIRINETTGAIEDWQNLSWGSTIARPNKLPAIYYDQLVSGSHRLWLVFPDNGSIGGVGNLTRVRGLYSDTAAEGTQPFFMELATTLSGTSYNYDLAGAVRTTADFGADRIVVTRRNAAGAGNGVQIAVFNPDTMANIPAEDWDSGGGGTSVQGLGYNAVTGQFTAVLGTGQSVHYHKVYWTDNSNAGETWYAAHNWAHNDGLGTILRTRRGPAQAVAVRKRQRVDITSGLVPVGLNMVEFFWKRSNPGLPDAGASDMTKNGDVTGLVAGTRGSVDYGAANVPIAFTPLNDPAVNGFGAGSPSLIQSSGMDLLGARSIQLHGDGDWYLDPDKNMDDTGWMPFTGGAGEAPFAGTSYVTCMYRRIGKLVQVRVSKNSTAARDNSGAASENLANINVTAASALPADVRPPSSAYPGGVGGTGDVGESPATFVLTTAGTTIWVGGDKRNYLSGTNLTCRFEYFLD